MNIYRISQIENGGYDTYDSAIVAAPDEETARNTHPSGSVFLSGWVTSDKVCVELIGTAFPGMEAGVLCASFNAG